MQLKQWPHTIPFPNADLSVEQQLAAGAVRKNERVEIVAQFSRALFASLVLLQHGKRIVHFKNGAHHLHTKKLHSVNRVLKKKKILVPGMSYRYFSRLLQPEGTVLTLLF